MEYDQENQFVDEALAETDEDIVHGSISSDSSDSEAKEQPKEKLRMKIKIPKAVKDDLGESVHNQGPSRRTCHECGKEFTSGKAYGGHVRIHFKERKNGRLKKIRNMKQVKKQISSDAAALVERRGCITIKAGDLKLSDGKISCCLCGKHFQSMNSLFGHMRNHPERGWKGIRPPPSDKNSCCSSVSDNVVIEADEISCTTENNLGSISDPLTPLQSWSSKGKRGQNCLPNQVPEAAHCLMKLARGESGGRSQSEKRKIEKSMIRNQSDFLSKKLKIDDCKAWRLTSETKEARRSGNIIEEKMDKGKRMAVLTTKSNQEAVYMDCESRKQLSDSSLIDRKMMAKEKKMKRHTEIVDKNQRKISTKPEKCSRSMAMEASYQYGICGNTSPTGQAFGGDKKCHSAGPLSEVTLPAETSWIGPKIASAGEATQATEASHGGSKMLDFDLNEPYVEPDGKGTVSTFKKV